MSKFKGKVAVHSITWGDQFIKGFEEASKLGYRAIEPWPTYVLQFENEETKLIETLDRYGLIMTGVYGGASGAAGRQFIDPTQQKEIIEYNVRLAKIASKSGASHIVFGPGGPRKKAPSLDELKQAATTINEAAKRTMEYGVKACLHPHLWTEIERESELDTIMELSVPEVFFAPDTAHLTGAGMVASEIIDKYQERVAYVHLKDLTSTEAKIEDFPMLIGNEALPVFCELGLGQISFKEIMDQLVQIDYRGWLTIEIDQSTSTPYQSLKQCRDFVEQKLGIPIQGVDVG